MVFIASFFEAGCELVSFSRMAFPPVLFMSRIAVFVTHVHCAVKRGFAIRLKRLKPRAPISGAPKCPE